MSNQLLTKLELRNFRCFRKHAKFPFSQGTYLIGPNNAGKSVVIDAIRFFFDNNLYKDEGFLNKTEFLSKGSGYNRSEITLDFNVKALSTKVLKRRLEQEYGKTISISKIITFTPIAKAISFIYKINGKEYPPLGLPDDINKLIKSIRISYLHPQEGRNLYKEAQEKLKNRLLANWGRHSTITKSLKKLQEDWDALCKKAKTYLSGSLTQSIQEMWPGSLANIELPSKILDIIAIADISFQGNKSFPEIQLTSQGTGAQSTILYLIHFLLDSDRSLHLGEYNPIWLLEEPESFLHADLMVKLAKELSSKEWLNNIQMIVSTHSPIMLATSRIGGTKIRWSLLRSHALQMSRTSNNWLENEINDIGDMMGDVNFSAYFLAATNKTLVFIEDSKSITIDRFKEAGIDVAQGLGGTGNIQKYLDVFTSNNTILNRACYFILDCDRGLSSFSRFLTKIVRRKEGFKKYQIRKNVFIILLPDGFSSEDLFNEFDNYLDECIDKIWNTSTWTIKPSIPSYLSNAASAARGKVISNPIDAKTLIRNNNDIKDSFWKIVDTEKLKMSKHYIAALKHLLS
ncbi:MAG: AAA family ATPase [Candidatus Margulisbacteria bacterium]|nr:AAA family ATPase [Candidatus Margulisiibacteriota bacterium]